MATLPFANGAPVVRSATCTVPELVGVCAPAMEAADCTTGEEVVGALEPWFVG
jgi:hypothetical protein